MTTLDLFRIVNLVAWLGVAVFMARGAYVAAFGKARRGDPMRLGCFTTAVVIVGFNLRWLVAPESVAVWVALYILSALDGLFIISLGRTYGRGGYVD